MYTFTVLSFPSYKFGPYGVSRYVHPGVFQGNRQEQFSHAWLLVTMVYIGSIFGCKLHFKQRTRCPWRTSCGWLFCGIAYFPLWILCWVGLSPALNVVVCPAATLPVTFRLYSEVWSSKQGGFVQVWRRCFLKWLSWGLSLQSEQCIQPTHLLLQVVGVRGDMLHSILEEEHRKPFAAEADPGFEKGGALVAKIRKLVILMTYNVCSNA